MTTPTPGVYGPGGAINAPTKGRTGRPHDPHRAITHGGRLSAHSNEFVHGPMPPRPAECPKCGYALFDRDGQDAVWACACCGKRVY